MLKDSGAIAGPVVAAAVLLPESDDAAAWLPAGDCKSLSRAARLDAYERLRAAPRVLWSCAAVDHRAVDSLGPQAAAHAAAFDTTHSTSGPHTYTERADVRIY